MQRICVNREHEPCRNIYGKDGRKHDKGNVASSYNLHAADKKIKCHQYYLHLVAP